MTAHRPQYPWTCLKCGWTTLVPTGGQAPRCPDCHPADRPGHPNGYGAIIPVNPWSKL